MNTFSSIVGLFLGLVVVIALFALGVAYGIARPACLASYSNYNPQWGFWSGCRAEWKGVLTPVDMIRNINVN